MSNEFQSTIYNSQGDMLDAIAVEWLTAGGANDIEFIRAYLRDKADAELADEAIKGWRLDRPDEGFEPRDPSHMEQEGYTAADLAKAFARLRASPSEYIPDWDGE